MSALPSRADMLRGGSDVGYVPTSGHSSHHSLCVTLDLCRGCTSNRHALNANRHAAARAAKRITEKTAQRPGRSRISTRSAPEKTTKKKFLQPHRRPHR